MKIINKILMEYKFISTDTNNKKVGKCNGSQNIILTNLGKFFECRICSSEFKTKFIICEDCKECHVHMKNEKKLEKSDKFFQAMKLNASKKINSRGEEPIQTYRDDFLVNAKSDINDLQKEFSDKKFKTKINQFHKSHSLTNLVEIVDKSILKICYCRLNEHKTNIKKKTNYKRNSITEIGVNEDNLQYNNCLFKGRIGEEGNKICDFCLINCSKTNFSKNDLTLTDFSINFKDKFVPCKCMKHNHENIFLFNEFISSGLKDQTFINENLPNLLKKFSNDIEDTKILENGNPLSSFLEAIKSNKLTWNRKQHILNLIIQLLINFHSTILLKYNCSESFDYLFESLNFVDSQFNKFDIETFLEDISLEIKHSRGAYFSESFTKQKKYDFFRKIDPKQLNSLIEFILLQVLLIRFKLKLVKDANDQFNLNNLFDYFNIVLKINLLSISENILQLINKDQATTDSINMLMIINLIILYIVKILKYYLRTNRLDSNKIELLPKIIEIGLTIVKFYAKSSPLFNLDNFKKTDFSNFFMKLNFSIVKLNKIINESVEDYLANHIIHNELTFMEDFESLFITTVNLVNKSYSIDNFSVVKINLYITEIILSKLKIKDHNSNYNRLVYLEERNFKECIENSLPQENYQGIIATCIKKLDEEFSIIYKFDQENEKISNLYDLLDNPYILDLNNYKKKLLSYISEFDLLKVQREHFKKIFTYLTFLLKYFDYIGTGDNSYESVRKNLDLDDNCFINNVLLKLIPVFFFAEEEFIYMFIKPNIGLLHHTNHFSSVTSYFLFLNIIIKRLTEESILNKLMIDDIVYHFNCFLNNIVTTFLISDNHECLDFYNLFDLVYSISKFYSKLSGDKGLLHFYNYFKNFFMLFFIPYIKEAIDLLVVKLKNFSSVRMRSSFQSIKNLRTSRTSVTVNDSKAFNESVFEILEYKMYIKLIKLIGLFTNRLLLDNKNSLVDVHKWYMILRLNEVDFISICSYHTPRREKVKLVNVLLDFYVGMFPINIYQDEELLNQTIQKNPFCDPEDIFIENYFSICSYDKESSEDDNKFCVKLLEFIADLVISDIISDTSLISDNRREIIYKTLFLMKISSKFIRVLYYQRKLLDLSLLNFKYNKSKNQGFINIYGDFIKTDNMNYIDILTISFISIYERCTEEFNHITSNFSNNIEEILKMIKVLRSEFAKMDSYMKLNYLLEILTKLIYSVNYTSYSDHEIHQFSKYNSLYDTICSEDLAEYLEKKTNFFGLPNFQIILDFFYYVESSKIVIFKDAINKSVLHKIRPSPNYTEVSNFVKNIEKENLYYSNVMKNSLFEHTIFTLKNDNQIVIPEKFAAEEFCPISQFWERIDKIQKNEMRSNLLINVKEKYSDLIDLIYSTYNKNKKNLSEVNFNYSILRYNKYYFDFNEIIHMLTSYSNFQELFNNLFLNINYNVPILLIFNMVHYSLDLIRLELFAYGFIYKEENCMNIIISRKKAFENVISILEILKVILQDNKEKHMIEQLNENLNYSDHIYGFILLLCSYITNFHINLLLAENNSKLMPIFQEYIVLLQKCVDLFCEYNQGSFVHLEKNKTEFLFSLKILLKMIHYDDYIKYPKMLNDIINFKYQGYFLIKFILEEYSSHPLELKESLKDFDKNILIDDFVMSNYLAEQLIRKDQIDNNKSHAEIGTLFSILPLSSHKIEEEQSFKTGKLIFIVMKYMQNIYSINELDEFLKVKNEDQDEDTNNKIVPRKDTYSDTDIVFKTKTSSISHITSKASSKFIVVNKDESENKHLTISDILHSIKAMNNLKSFYAKIIRKIDINYSADYMNLTKANNEQNLRLIFFDITTDYFQLSPSSKFFFLNECNRANQLSKLEDLLDNIDFFLREINYINNQSESLSKQIFQIINIKQCEFILFFFTLTINLMILSFIDQKNKVILEGENVFALGLEYYTIFKILSVLQVLWCLFVVVIWILDRFTVYVKSMMLKNQIAHDKANKPFTLLSKLKVVIIDSFLKKNEINGFLYTLILGIIALFSGNSAFLYGLQLISVINLNKYLKNLLYVIYNRFEQIFQTLILLFIIVYIFTLIAFYFFNHEFYYADLEENLCGSILQCYMILINYALRSDGDIMPKHAYSVDKQQTLKRFFFDILFFFPVNMLLLNAILGIIVDTFKELRQERDRYDNDKDNVCFICGIERHEIKSQGEDFEEHVNQVHDIWNYAYFLLNLNKLQGKDMNTYELYLDTLIKCDNYSIFPNKTFWKAKI